MDRFVLVLCEGKEDKMVFEKIASLAGLSGMKIEDYGGKDKLVNHLRALKERPDFTRNQIHKIAITRDADDSHDSAWDSLCSSAKSGFGINLASPGQLTEMPGGTPDKDPTIGVTGWVVPGSGEPGMLESLCLQSVAEQPAFRCLTDYVTCVEASLSPNKQTGQLKTLHPKAKFHAWVVTHTDFKDRDYNIATAVKEDRFIWEHAVFDGLRNMLRSLVS